MSIKGDRSFSREWDVYYSFDCAVHNLYKYFEEFLNILTTNDLPTYVLKLKIDCPVILLRNMTLRMDFVIVPDLPYIGSRRIS
jgi:hypothetical protein